MRDLFKLVLIVLVCIIPLLASAQLWQNTTESLGFDFQYNQFRPEQGDNWDYISFSIPLSIRYDYTRYTSIAINLNQGYQSFAGYNMYGIDDLNLSLRQMIDEDFTIMAGFKAPVGTKELTSEEISVASVGSLPYVASPLSYGKGIGFNGGLVYGIQVNEMTNMAVGTSYNFRGNYKALENGSDYDPSDELFFALGFEYGSPEDFGVISDIQYAVYTAEKMDGNTISEPGNGIAATLEFYYYGTELSASYSSRQPSELHSGSEFEAPAVITAKLGKEVGSSIVPYLGFQNIGEGSRVDASNLFFIGGYLKDYKLNDYPIAPYMQFKYGFVGDGATTLGINAGMDVAFSMY